MIRRFAVLGFFACTGFITLSCSDGPIESPVEPQFAKGSKPGKPTPAEPVLEEFWVHKDDAFCLGGQVIHVVVSGEFLWLETAVTQDHWFNGIRDFLVLSGSDEHYEQVDRGPVQPPTTVWNTDGTTMGHIDVCFTGERVDFVHPGGEIQQADFLDAPSTSVEADGYEDGADPFAFTVYAVTDEIKFKPNVSKRFRPTGVVVGGFTRDPDPEGVGLEMGTSEFHPLQSFDDVRSYAIYKAPDSHDFVSFESINLTASCQVTTSTVGRGKKATQVTQTTVTAEAAFGFWVHDENGILQEDWPSYGFVWTEAHLRVSKGDEELYFSGPERQGFRSPEGLTTYTWTMDGEFTGDVKVELLVDNLTLEANPNNFFPYHPGFNRVTTTAGDPLKAWNASTNVSSVINDGKFPVAWPEAKTVTCGQG